MDSSYDMHLPILAVYILREFLPWSFRGRNTERSVSCCMDLPNLQLEVRTPPAEGDCTPY